MSGVSLVVDVGCMVVLPEGMLVLVPQVVHRELRSELRWPHTRLLALCVSVLGEIVVLYVDVNGRGVDVPLPGEAIREERLFQRRLWRALSHRLVDAPVELRVLVPAYPIAISETAGGLQLHGAAQVRRNLGVGCEAGAHVFQRRARLRHRGLGDGTLVLANK